MNIIGEFILLFNASGVFYIVFPINPGENLIQVRLIINPINIFLISYGSSTIIIALIGFFLKSIQSQGVMRRKYLYLFISTFTIAFIQVLESLIDIGYGIILTRISILIAVFLWYYSLREMKEKKERPQKKEVDVKDSLFMIARRPEHISQEDVTFHKEQKVCLVCKGSISRVSYICPSCSALYCINCSEVLSNQENACWICNEPFDESKPSKPFKKEEEVVKVLQVIAHFLKKKKKKRNNKNK
jgi:hypothetical protein